MSHELYRETELVFFFCRLTRLASGFMREDAADDAARFPSNFTKDHRGYQATPSAILHRSERLVD